MLTRGTDYTVSGLPAGNVVVFDTNNLEDTFKIVPINDTVFEFCRAGNSYTTVI